MATRRYVGLSAVLSLVRPAAAYAASTACSANDNSLNCRLVGLLHWLEAAAFVLVLILIVVILVTFHLFRKNRMSRKGGR